MFDPAQISLIALAFAAIFGLQGALSLAIRHHLAEDHNPLSACNRIALSKEARILNVPVAYGAVMLYGFVLVILVRGIYLEELQIFWLNSVISMAMLVTCYYAFVMFFKLHLFCMGCIRIYLANLLMVAALSFYHLY